MTKVARDVFGLSSGTMAVLSREIGRGTTLYTELEALQYSFFCFVNTSKVEYRNWIDAWIAYCERYGYTRKVGA